MTVCDEEFAERKGTGSIGADAPAATFGKTVFTDFASVRHKV